MSTPIRPETDHGAAYAPPTDGTGQPPSSEPSSLVEDFIEVFYAPSQVFARRAKSGFGVALLVVSLVAGLFAFGSRSLMSAAFDGEFSRNATRMMAQNPRLTEEMLTQQRGISENIALIASYVGTPILIFFVAVLVWLAAKVVSAKFTYQQAVLITTFAWIPRLVGGLLTTVQALIMDATQVTSMHAITYSPSRFMDPDATSRQLLGLLSRLDVFTIWVTVLIGIGIAVIGKVPRGRGFIAAAIVWVVGTLPVLAAR